MELSELGATLGLLLAGYMVAGFVYVNHLLNKEAQAAKVKREAKKALREAANRIYWENIAQCGKRAPGGTIDW